jgi:hypothetical protein
MTMSDKIPMFPTAHPPRADEDTATIEQVMEHDHPDWLAYRL